MAAIPERLGKYPITGMLGRGAMGVVYRGYDPVIKRPVAIKTIRKELIDEEERTEAMSGRFRREAQAAGTLSHPGIVAIYEYGEDAQHAFIAMEFVEGNSLRDYMARGVNFDEHDSVSIMAQLLDALWPLLAPGGRLLYATCSVFKAEGQAQIATGTWKWPAVSAIAPRP